MAEVLIIDDDETMCRMLTRLVTAIEHQAEYALTLKAGLKKMMSRPFDVVFLDVGLPDGSGLELLYQIRETDAPPEVIIMTGAGDPDGAEIAIKNGAWDYLQKPLSPKKVILPLKRVLQYRDNLKNTRQAALIFTREGIVGSSPRLRACLDDLALAAGGDANVLITGETGTGKEVFARALHRNSPRSRRNFVVVDCAALPETLVESYLFGYEKGAFTGADRSEVGLIRQADGGTLFLDEAGELSPSLQKAFLRVLQEKSFRPVGGKEEIRSDFRLVAATNQPLDELAENGLFRRDLLFRLRAVSIELPPLKSRPEDIRDLAVYYLDRISARYGIRPKGFSPDFMGILNTYDWPGNVRELINTLESAISQARHEPILFPAHLPSRIRVQAARAAVDPVNPSAGDDTCGGYAVKTGLTASEKPPRYREFREFVLADAEKKYLRSLMRYTGGDIRDACQISGLGRTRLYTLLKKRGISRKT